MVVIPSFTFLLLVMSMHFDPSCPQDTLATVRVSCWMQSVSVLKLDAVYIVRKASLTCRLQFVAAAFTKDGCDSC